MKFISIKTKILTMVFIIMVTSITIIATYSYNNFKVEYVKETVSNQMNFVDAKQQGTIRFIDQNIKLSQTLSESYIHSIASEEGMKNFALYISDIVKTDVFKIDEHHFADEIRSGEREIHTWQVYHSIDVIENGQVITSSDTTKVGQQAQSYANEFGYSDVYEKDGKYFLTFAKTTDAGKEIQVHVDAWMLTIITNGEIGNMGGKMGAFYLAGVGPTMDFYMVNRDNVMITDSRVFSNAMLKQKGSVEPWDKTLNGANSPECGPRGTYKTNAGVITGCPEAMGYYTGTDGKLKLGSSMPYYDTGWTIVVEEDAADVLAPLFKVRDTILISTILLILIGLVVAFWISSAIANPLIKLTSVGEDISGGNFDVEIPKIKSNDESGKAAKMIAVLMEVANAMKKNK